MEVAPVLVALAVAVVVTLALALPLVAAWRWWRRRARLVQMLRGIPGPFALPLLGSTVAFLGVKREDIFSVLTEITNRYLPTMVFWRGSSPEIHLSRAEDLEVILSSSVHTDKASTYDFLRPWLGDGLLTSKGAKWHSRRKLITPTFHFKILEAFVDVFAEKSRVMAEMLRKELGSEEGFDVYPYVTLCTLDIICETAMGTQINAQRNSHSEYVKAVYGITEGVLQRMLSPWLHPDFIFYRSSKGQVFKKNLKVLHNFTNKVIEERRKTLDTIRNVDEDNIYGARRRLAFLDLLLAASRDGAALSDEEIREEVDTFMFEGHDTTSAGVCWALFLLGAHRDVQDKAAEELEAIFQGSDRTPTMKDLAEMKYLERVIKETLRLYPSVPRISRNVKDDVKLEKYTVPAGTTVALRFFHTHRDPRYFPNPEKFDPDNFLPERVRSRHPYAYVPFSAGSRNCIGQKFAVLEEKALLSTLLRYYVIAAVDRPDDLKITTDLILRPANGVRLRLRLRK